MFKKLKFYSGNKILEIILVPKEDDFILTLKYYESDKIISESNSMIINKKSVDYLEVFFSKKQNWSYYDRLNTNYLYFDFLTIENTFKIGGSIVNCTNFIKTKFEIIEIPITQFSTQLASINK